MSVSGEPTVAVPASRPRWRVLPGVVALGLAAAGLIVEVVAIVVAAPAGASEAMWTVSTVLAWAATGLTAAAVLLGLLAVIARLGRWWGAPAIVLGLLANPWLQTLVLGALD